MQKLVQGIHHFQTNIFSAQRDLFQRLAEGQDPETLFITCSDSRINPNLLTQTGPGDLFILRNAGNLVPPYGAVFGGEAATIEYAVAALGVKDIIVCGHSLCGAMSGLLAPESLKELPSVADWLRHAEATRRIIKQNYSDLEGQALLTATVEENVLVQLENLRTHPAVAAALSRGGLTLHGWAYEIETGEVFAFDPQADQFLPLSELYGTPEPVKAPVSADSRKTRRAAEAIGP
jgi:carbonic anhydrase